MTILKGFDVSKWQGEFPWAAVITQNTGEDQISFAIIKATSGMNDIDPQFERNYSEAKRLQVPLGAYHFFYYADKVKHDAEMDNFIKALSGKTFEMPVFLDYEASKAPDNHPLSELTKQVLTDYAIEDQNKLKAAGFRVGIYANKNWLENKLDTSRFPADLWVWLANYTKQTTYAGHYDLWQYTSQGYIKGYGGPMDLNYLYRAIADPKEDILMDGFTTPVKTYSKATEGEMKLANNFKVEEFACHDGSDKILIDTYLVYLAQKIRDHFAASMNINSGYRSPTYNASIGGATESQHMYGRAIDFTVSGHTPKEIYDWCNTWHTGGLGLYSGWVHIDTGSNRRWKG